MTLLKQYDTPAFVVDFPDDPTKQAEMNRLWSANVVRWVEAALVGDVFDLVNYGPRPAFYNPTVTDTPSDAMTVPIKWNAFPGRFSALFPEQQTSWFRWGDEGGIPSPPVDLCSGKAIPAAPYSPTGPRGWQDEYCEWCVTRDPKTGKITRIDYTCENPEYWFTLWACDPNAVLEQYRSLVDPKVALADLALKDAQGRPVVDPATGLWAYDPLNRWNSGPLHTSDKGGAVHLTSSPNTLGAEFDLAAGGSMARVDGKGQPVTSASALVCCGRFGRIGRNSDPHVGQNVNALVNSSGLQGARVTLTNPPGLYIQTPQWSRFAAPDGSDPSRYWTVMRGRTGTGAATDIDRILHARFEVPAGKSFVVGDITVDGDAIAYGGQVTSTITMALLGTGFATGGPNQAGVPCTAKSPNPIPAAVAMQDLGLFKAYRLREEQADEIPLSIPILAFPVPAGSTVAGVAIATNLADAPASATVTATGGGVTITVTDTQVIDQTVVLVASVAAAASAAPGDRGIVVTVPGMPTSSQAAIGLMTVTAPAAVPVAANARSGGRRTAEGRLSHRAGRA